MSVPDEPIEGAYAAREVAGGLHHGYMAGAAPPRQAFLVGLLRAAC